MSKLLIKPHEADENGNIINITPELARWTYVGFQVYVLQKKKKLKKL